MIMTMILVNISQVKAKLSEYLAAVGRGEQVMICKRNRPIAELCAIAQQRTKPRPIGGTKGIVLLPSFFEPMPDDFLEAFETGPVYSPPTRRSRVAERSARAYGPSRRGKRTR